MKRVALALWTFSALTRAADLAQITAQLDVIQLPQAQAMKVIPLLEDSDASVAALQDLSRESTQSRDGGPIIVHTLVARAMEGQSAVAETAGNPRYPIEYKQESPSTHAAVSAGSGNEPSGYPISYFEERSGNGVKFTIGTERPAAQGGVIRLSAAVEASTFDGWTFFETGVLPDGRILRVQLPVFCWRQAASVMIARTGVPVLLASFKLPGEENRFELHVVTATAKPLRGISEAALKGNKPLDPAAPNVAKTPPFPVNAYCGELFVFSVPAERALSMRSMLGNAEPAAELLKQLLADLPQNPEALIDRLSLPATAGNRGFAKGGTEVRYHIEMQHSPGPQTFGGGGGPPPTRNLDPEPRKDPPWNFETQLIGTGFELEIAEEDWDGQFQSSVLPFIPGSQFNVTTSRQRGFHRWANVVNPDGRMSVQYHPSIESKRMGGRLALWADNVTLIGFHADPIPAKQCQLTFLRIRRAPILVPKK